MDYIEIEKKKHPFLFAIRANREMSKCEDLAKKDDIYFVWLGFKYGAIRESKDCPFTEDALVDLFEDDMDLFAECEALLGEQMGKLKAAKAPAMKALLE